MRDLPSDHRALAPVHFALLPALRARVARSRFEAGKAFHLLAFAAIVLGAMAFQVAAGHKLEQRRASLLARAASETAKLTPRQATLLPRAERWVLEESGAYAGDLVAPELVAKGALEAWLARPGVYLRGVAEEMARPGSLTWAARPPRHDTVALCLLKPPTSADGAAMLEAATHHYIGGALFEDDTASVRPLREVTEGLRVLMPAWADEVRAVDAPLWMDRVELEFQSRGAAARAAGLKAAEADYLVLTLDEVPADVRIPEVGPAITDHQRESVLSAVEDRAHDARLVIIDLERGRPLLRLRRRLDAGALGVAMYAIHRSALQGCQLGAAAHAL